MINSQEFQINKIQRTLQGSKLRAGTTRVTVNKDTLKTSGTITVTTTIRGVTWKKHIFKKTVGINKTTGLTRERQKKKKRSSTKLHVYTYFLQSVFTSATEYKKLHNEAQFLTLSNPPVKTDTSQYCTSITLHEHPILVMNRDLWHTSQKNLTPWLL